MPIAPLADPVVFQVDGTTAIALVTSILTGLAAGLAGGAKILVSYLREKDKAQEEKNLLRDEKIRELAAGSKELGEDFRGAVKELTRDFQTEHRKSFDAQVGITKDAVQAMAAISNQVGDLGAGVADLKTEVRHLGDTVGELGVSVATLTTRVDGIDTKRGGKQQ
jgi:hypothetical protein